MTLYICPICKKRIRDHKTLEELVSHYDDAINFTSHMNSLVILYGADKLVDNK